MSSNKSYRFRGTNFTVPRRYAMTREIGLGAFGVVVAGSDTQTRASVAVKKVSGALQHVSVARQTLRELRLLRHFRGHPNIVMLRDTFRTEEESGDQATRALGDTPRGDIYLVFELMEGDLSRVLGSGRALTVEHCRLFVYQLLRGLKYLHSANVIHRDIKPQNLLINSQCALKIADFGMARVVADSTESHMTFMTEYVATRWYRAPEVMLSFSSYETVMDMWSVGCILAEMFGKGVLFAGENYVHQLRLTLGVTGPPDTAFIARVGSEQVRAYLASLLASTTGPSVPLRALYPDADSEALSLLARLLVLDPARRMTAADALAHPFMGRYHNRPGNSEPVCPPAVLEFDREEMGLTRLADLIDAEVVASAAAQALMAPIGDAPGGARGSSSVSDTGAAGSAKRTHPDDSDETGVSKRPRHTSTTQPLTPVRDHRPELKRLQAQQHLLMDTHTDTGTALASAAAVPSSLLSSLLPSASLPALTPRSSIAVTDLATQLRSQIQTPRADTTALEPTDASPLEVPSASDALPASVSASVLLHSSTASHAPTTLSADDLRDIQDLLELGDANIFPRI